MIDLPCEKNKSPAPGIYQIQSAFLNSLLHRTLTCPAAGFYTEETLQLRGAGHKHHWDFFLSLCLQLLGISGKKQLGVGVHAWNHRKPRQESAASLGCVVKPLPPQINKGRHEGRERHAKEPPRPKSVSVANNTIAMTEQVIKARGLLCSKVKRSSLLTTSSRSDLATEWIQNQHNNKMKCHS